MRIIREDGTVGCFWTTVLLFNAGVFVTLTLNCCLAGVLSW